MSPEVIAAIIAASVSFLTLIGTLAAQYFGRRATERDTKEAFEEQRIQLDKTLEAQSDQLDKTLTEQRTRTLNERFATAAEQLGTDKPAAVRLAGVYAMAGLADDWEANRQTCIDVLCAYLRMPYEPDPGDQAPVSERLAFRASREVRHTVIRVIAAHLKDDAPMSWQGLNFDFTGATFDGGSFSGARFLGGTVDFFGAEFSGGKVAFDSAEFSGRVANFNNTRFSGGTVQFGGALFSGGVVTFGGAVFSSGLVDFFGAEFSGGLLNFSDTRFSGGRVNFFGAEFSGGEVRFNLARFSGGLVDFACAEFSGGVVDLTNARFSGGLVDFSDVSDWSCPPLFSWTEPPPQGVKLPGKKDQSRP